MKRVTGIVLATLLLTASIPLLASPLDFGLNTSLNLEDRADESTYRSMKMDFTLKISTTSDFDKAKLVMDLENLSLEGGGGNEFIQFFGSLVNYSYSNLLGTKATISLPIMVGAKIVSASDGVYVTLQGQIGMAMGGIQDEASPVTGRLVDRVGFGTAGKFNLEIGYKDFLKFQTSITSINVTGVNEPEPYSRVAEDNISSIDGYTLDHTISREAIHLDKNILSVGLKLRVQLIGPIGLYGKYKYNEIESTITTVAPEFDAIGTKQVTVITSEQYVDSSGKLVNVNKQETVTDKKRFYKPGSGYNVTKSENKSEHRFEAGLELGF